MEGASNEYHSVQDHLSLVQEESGAFGTVGNDLDYLLKQMLLALAPGFESYEDSTTNVGQIERSDLKKKIPSNCTEWNHKVGWLDKPGSECNWHGV